jgi:phosphatidylserine/phosphatidylglycerophosphate/cardiolipin synthase-like enzyme
MKRWYKALALLIFMQCAAAPKIIDVFAYLQQALSWPLRPHYSFFGPGDNIKALLMGFIGHESRFIRATLYRMTDPDVSEELIKAWRRGVKVEIVMDGTGVNDGHSKVAELQRAGVKIHVHPSSAYRIMHLKMFIFGNSMYNRPYVWSGSANPTGGLTRNAEHVMVLTDGSSITRCDQEFQRLKESCKKANS